MKSLRRFAVVAGTLATVLLVALTSRATAPAGRYTFPVAGVVFDTKTGLTWQRTVAGGAVAEPTGSMNCGATSLNGAAGRLPTLQELLTIVDYAQTSGALVDATAFPSTATDNYYCTSTPYAGLATAIWVMHFGDASTLSQDYTTSVCYARCVR
jgi:hypothetical protein